MDSYDYQPIPDETDWKSLEPENVKREVKIDFDDALGDLPDSDLDKDLIEEVSRRMREEVYDKIITGSIGTSIMAVSLEDPVAQSFQDVFHRQYSGKTCGIGIHKNTWGEIKKEHAANADSERRKRKLHGIPVAFDSRRSRNQTLLFQSSKLWNAYRELLGGSMPSFVQRMVRQQTSSLSTFL